MIHNTRSIRCSRGCVSFFDSDFSRTGMVLVACAVDYGGWLLNTCCYMVFRRRVSILDIRGDTRDSIVMNRRATCSLQLNVYTISNTLAIICRKTSVKFTNWLPHFLLFCYSLLSCGNNRCILNKSGAVAHKFGIYVSEYYK